MAAPESNNPKSLGEAPLISGTAVEDESIEKFEMDEEKSGEKIMEAGLTHGVGAPPELDMNLPSVEDRLRELVEKFHHNEKQYELDRSRGHFQPPLPVPSDMQLRRIQAERYSRPSGRGEAFDSAKRHRLDLMSMYRRELEFLEREDELFEELTQDRGYRGRNTKVHEPQGERRSSRSSSRSSAYFPRPIQPRADTHQPGPTKTVEQTPIPELPKYATPKLNYVEWVEFKGIMDKREKDSFAIDVLKGEPVIVFVDTRNLFSSTKSLRYGKQAEITVKRKGPVNLKHQLLPGQAPFPERIRINSSPIIKTLTQIHGTKLRTDEFTPIIMIRPFKTLEYYSSQIQQRIQELETKFEGQNPLDPSITNQRDTGGSVLSKSIAIGDGTKADVRGSLMDNRSKNSNQIIEQNKVSLADGTSTYGDNFNEDRETMSVTTLEHLRCLNDFLKLEVQTKLEYLRSDRCKNVAFDDLWYLFRPGDEVVGQHRRQAYRIISMTGVSHQVIPPWKTSWGADKSSDDPEEAPVILKCVYVDFDGKELGPVSKIVEIPRYDGEKAVKALEVYPIRFAEDSESTSEVKDPFRRSLIARGRKFLSVLGMKHMYYNGFTLETKDEVDSQVVVDFEEAFASRKERVDFFHWMPRLEVLIGSSAEDRYPPIRPCTFDCCKDESIHLDTTVERRRNEEYIDTLIPRNRNVEPSLAIYPQKVETKGLLEVMVTDDELVIMSHRVFGFILRSRKWSKLDLAFLHPINSRERAPTSERQRDENTENITGNAERKEETAFDQLVLPDGHKKMVVSLVAQHFRDKESVVADEEQTDIVRGKGKGLIILLHGLPGVGKTTTAEGVAELFRKPLFQITCGDLGTTASEVESALERHFSLASRWGCILLLDEADVFLAARTPQDFIRNGLVSVFLRVLEYYAGILFLTTNRIGDFDEAFASRIHISLHYPELSLEPTLEIFKLNMRLIRERRYIEIDEESILAFADHYWRTNVKMRWNGRQIRNACQTALALAEFDAQGGNYERVVDANAKVKLTVAHLEIVSKAYLDFIIYLKKIYGQTGERRAKAMGIRAREEMSGNKHEEDEGEREGTMVAEGKKKMTMENPYASFSQPPPQPSHSAPAQAVYPYGPPLAAQPGAYPPGPAGPGYYYPPQGYPAPPPSWQPPPGALGQYGSTPMDPTGGRQSKEWK